MFEEPYNNNKSTTGFFTGSQPPIPAGEEEKKSIRELLITKCMKLLLFLASIGNYFGTSRHFIDNFFVSYINHHHRE